MKANFGFLLYDGVEELDVAGPWEMIGLWRDFADGPQHIFTVSEKGEPVRAVRGMRIMADYRFADCPPCDFLLVPGGNGRRQQVNNPQLLKFIKDQAQHCQHVLSVCTGMFLLHAAGLLSGKKVTTYWRWYDELLALGDVELVSERWVRDGNTWTGAGVSSGIDLALALIAEVSGEKTAGQVQLYAEYYPSKIYYGDAHLDPRAPQYLVNPPAPEA